ncbi:hypothetical protein QNM34_07775 [Rahnella bonaserana]|uniref:hypothetical protein n=1 Tax=Rahnella bonaserana TaxID=2816248 RepID=UPI0024C3B09D|nr:hypothetical protein [Rahnella bonaserana]WHZ42164.1 hypothetical protein QNM34_07775 [Rahnella bonaserana]
MIVQNWDGESFPPAGCECEIYWNEKWMKCVVIAHRDEQVIFRAEKHREWAGHKNNYKFRPIRSPEYIARDKAIRAFEEAVDNCIDRSKVLEFIYDTIAEGKIPGIKLDGAE